VQTRWVSELSLAQLEFVENQIGEHERRLQHLVQVTPTMEALMTLPGIGIILAATITWGVGDIERLACAERLPVVPMRGQVIAAGSPVAFFCASRMLRRGVEPSSQQ
jgi:hypothetical protein